MLPIISSRRETMSSANPLFFSTAGSGHMNGFKAANFHKLFLTISRVKQTGDFSTYFLAMPQFFWEESQECELTTSVVLAHSHVLYPSAWCLSQCDKLQWYVQVVGKAEAQGSRKLCLWSLWVCRESRLPLDLLISDIKHCSTTILAKQSSLGQS